MIPWKLLSVVFWAAYLLLPGRFFGADGSALLIKPAPLSVGAEQVHVQVTRSKGEMTVYWVSPLNISSIHYGTNKQNLENKIVSMSGVQYTYLGQQAASGFKREYRSNFLHELILVDLAQDTTYYYQVGDWKNLYSRVHSFKTRPGDPDAEISFSTLGDQGPGVNIRGSYAQRVLQQLEKDRINDHFMLHAGDIIYADGNQVTRPLLVCAACT